MKKKNLKSSIIFIIVCLILGIVIFTYIIPNLNQEKEAEKIPIIINEENDKVSSDDYNYL
ncbi:MAG: hypothetical protein ACOCRZ_04210 [Halothermotrichaceae bacterium]